MAEKVGVISMATGRLRDDTGDLGEKIGYIRTVVAFFGGGVFHRLDR
ncbi:MAG: hypothetical protein JXD23_12595 [Spirochaetales bacterium]|nr:hypothetical protein [Spirochaetales bacterium]